MYTYMTAVLDKCMEVLYRWYMKSTDITKYTVELPTAGKFSRARRRGNSADSTTPHAACIDGGRDGGTPRWWDGGTMGLRIAELHVATIVLRVGYSHGD